MNLKEFLTRAKEAFYSAVLNAIGSTTFWLTIVMCFLTGFGLVQWEAILAAGFGYTVNRAAQHLSENRSGK